MARSAVLAWVQDSFEGWDCHIKPEQIEDLARELKIDARRQWKLTREFLELHNKAQLAKLVEEWNHAGGLNLIARGTAKRGELIETIMQLPDGVKCPKEVLEAKRVRLIQAECLSARFCQNAVARCFLIIMPSRRNA